MAYVQLSYTVVPVLMKAACRGFGFSTWSPGNIIKETAGWMISILRAYARKLVLIFCRALYNLLCSLSFHRSTQHLLIGNDTATIAKPAEFLIAKSMLDSIIRKIHLLGLSFFHFFLLGSLAIIQLLSCSDCRKKVKTTCMSNWNWTSFNRPCLRE